MSTNNQIINNGYTTQNDLLMKNLREYYSNIENMDKVISIINGQSTISLRIVDWFTTNYSKKFYTCYNVEKENGEIKRFKSIIKTLPFKYKKIYPDEKYLALEPNETSLASRDPDKGPL